MSNYGALTSLQGSDKEQLPSGGHRLSDAKPKTLTGPIFLENPDGSITEGIPSSYKGPKAKKQAQSRRASQRTSSPYAMAEDSDTSSASETAAANLYREVDFLYSRHERVLAVLLALQFGLEVLYHVVYVIHMRNGDAVIEFTTMYALRIETESAAFVLWTVFAISVGYCVGYFTIAGIALWTKRPKQYRLFANYGIAGIVGLILLAYVDKFNLIIFFLHLLAYIYARFLQGLTASLLLLPPAPGTGAALA